MSSVIFVNKDSIILLYVDYMLTEDNYAMFIISFT